MRTAGLLPLILLLVACDKPEQKNLDAAQKMFSAFNEHDWKGMADFYADHAEFLDPSFGKEYVKQSREKVAEKYAQMELMFPDIRDDIKEIYAVEDKVFVQFVSFGNSGDSIKFELPIACILTFKDGKIIRDATYYDN